MQWIIILKCLLFSCFLSAQQTTDWVLICDSTNTQFCGYSSVSGEVKIPAGKYSRCFTPIFKEIAMVQIDSSIFCINKKEQVLFEVFCQNNYPDHPSEGTFRIIKNDKIGFATKKGEILIAPKYDAALPFKGGIAFINIGCEVDSTFKTTFWKGGKWGAINKTGTIVIPVKYSDMSFLSNAGQEIRTPTQD